MKKRVYAIVFLALLLIISFTALIAQEEPSIEESAKTAAGAVGISTDITGVKNTTAKLLESDVVIPESLQAPARFIFGIKTGETLDFSVFIVLIALWFALVFIIESALELMPIFGEGWKSWLGAAIITCLISITGVLIDVSNMFFGFGGFLEDFGMVRLIITVIILGLLAYGLSAVLHILKHKADVEVEEQREIVTGIKSVISKLKQK